MQVMNDNDTTYFANVLHRSLRLKELVSFKPAVKG